MYYGACLELRPQDPDIRMAICRILVREGRYADAVDWLGQRLDQDHSSRAIVGWYLECLFHLGRFAELRGIAARFGDLLLDSGDEEEDRLQQSARLWQIGRASCRERVCQYV